MSFKCFLKPLGCVMVGLLALLFAMACSSAQPTNTPVAPATPQAPATPTAAAVEATPTATTVLPTSTPASGGPQYGGTLRFIPEADWDSLDPAFSIKTGPRPANYAIYNNMVQLVPDGTIGPDLADSWDFSADGKTVTFHIHPNVMFSDGTPANAQAVKWNYDRYLDKSVISTRTAQLSPPLGSVSVVDDTTVAFNLSAPFRPLLATLTDLAGQIVSPTAVQKDNSYSDRSGSFGRSPVGSGPFMIKSWAPGVEVDLVRNPNYWDKGKPYLDGIRFIMQSDLAVRFAMLRTNEVDIIQRMTASDAQLAKQNPHVKISEQSGTTFRLLRFRVTADPWTNHDLIAAMAYAIDRDSLVKLLYNGLATPAYSPIGPAYGAWYDPTIKTYAYDPQKAKDMLAKAGEPNGFTYTQYCSSNGLDIQWCETLQSMFSQVGIKADIQLYSSSTYSYDFESGKIKAGPIETWVSPRADPHVNIQRMYESDGYSNHSGFANTQVDQLINEAAQVYDVAKAKDLYHQVLTIITEQAQDIYLVYETNLDGIRDNVRNYVQRLDNVARLREVWLAK